jgi:hypothetical protein
VIDVTSQQTNVSFHAQDLASVIQVQVPEEKTESGGEGEDRVVTPPRKYSYDDLLDLQSRLMLVAGQAEKGKENVDRFLHVSVSMHEPVHV